MVRTLFLISLLALSGCADVKPKPPWMRAFDAPADCANKNFLAGSVSNTLGLAGFFVGIPTLLITIPLTYGMHEADLVNGWDGVSVTFVGMTVPACVLGAPTRILGVDRVFTSKDQSEVFQSEK